MLYVNEIFTSFILNEQRSMKTDESRRLLDYLFSHLARPDYQCRWRWELGDVAVWGMSRMIDLSANARLAAAD